MKNTSQMMTQLLFSPGFVKDDQKIRWVVIVAALGSAKHRLVPNKPNDRVKITN
jgi:hypothetical protein